MSQPTQSSAGIVVVDANIFISICSREPAEAIARTALADYAMLLIKARLAHIVNEEIKRQKLTQAEAAKILRVNQSEVSRLTRSFGSFSPIRLMTFLNRLGRNVEIVVPAPRRSKKPAQTLVKAA